MHGEEAAEKSLDDLAEEAINLGWAAEASNASSSEAFYRVAAEGAPEYWRGHYMLGCLLQKTGRTDEALGSLWRAARLGIEHSEVHQALGTALAAAGKLDMSIAAFELATRIDPENPVLWTSLGLALTRRGNSASAEAAFRTALRFNPHDVNAFDGLSVLFVFAGRARELEELAHDYIAAHPDRRSAWGYLAISLSNQRRRHLTKLVCSELAQRFPDWGFIHVILGQSLNGLGDRKGAEAAFELALELDPGLPGAHAEIGLMRLNDGRLVEAGQRYLRAIAINAWYADGHSGMGKVFLKLGRIEEAETAFRTTLERQPFRSEALNGLGVILLQREDFLGALHYLSRGIAHDLSPSNGFANLGDAYAAIGAVAEAEAAYLEAVRHAPSNAYACTRMADLLERIGRKEEARDYRKRTTGFAPHPSLAAVNEVVDGAEEILDLVKGYLGNAG